MVWDNLNVHISDSMTGLVAARDWLTACRLPPYAHELNPVEPVWKAATVTGRTGRMASDLLGVNELHGSQYWSLAQLTDLLRSYEVGAGRRGCCTYLLY